MGGVHEPHVGGDDPCVFAEPTAFSPRVTHDALAGIAAGDGGELAFEGGADRKAVAPIHFGGRRGQRGIARLRGAVDHEARTGQRLERRRYGVVGVEIMRPRGAAAQRQDGIVDSPIRGSLDDPNSLRASATIIALRQSPPAAKN